MSDDTTGDAPKKDQRSGLDQVKALHAGEFPISPMTRLIPFTTLPPKKGNLAFRATPDETHLNGMGIVHGGWAMTMLDNAMGLAAHSMVEAGQICPSGETTVQFRAMIRPGTELHISAEVTGQTGDVYAVKGAITTAEGKVLATGQSTCHVICVEAK